MLLFLLLLFFGHERNAGLKVAGRLDEGFSRSEADIFFLLCSRARANALWDLERSGQAQRSVAGRRQTRGGEWRV